MDGLLDLDRRLFLLINGCQGALGDGLFTLVSGRLPWIPVGVLLLFFLVRRLGWRDALVVVLGAGLVVLVADQVSASVLKPLTARLRPCHADDLVGLVHLPTGRCGGQFGFVSSHAANFFGLATFLGLVLRNRIAFGLMLLCAILVGYSRIYMGVHYPGDVVCGAMLGGLVGWGVFGLYRRWGVVLHDVIHKWA